MAELKFQKIFAQRVGDNTTYCLLGNGFFRTISSNEEDSVISEWLRTHPKAQVVPVSIVGEGSKQPLVYFWAVDGSENLNLLLVRNGVFPGSVMLDAVHFDKLSKNSQDRAHIEAGYAYAQKLNPNLPEIKKIPPRRFVSDASYDEFFKELGGAQVVAQSRKIGIWSDKFKDLREDGSEQRSNVAKNQHESPDAITTAKQNYLRTCVACHTSGAVGAPRLGRFEEWGTRYRQPLIVLYQHAFEGFKLCPPRGGTPSFTEQEVHDIVDYMVSQVNR